MDQIQQTVFLVDDDESIRISLSRALRKRGFDVIALESAADLLKSYDEDDSGCLVLDYGMPDMDGLALQKELENRGYRLPIIFITGHGGVPESVQAMKAGALDFLEKPFRQDVLVERIRLAFELDARARQVLRTQLEARKGFERLTPREKEIVRFLQSNPSQTSSKDVGRQLRISPRTVDHHRSRILEKMNIKSVAELMSLSDVIAPDFE